jgi:hypothetical protein
MCGTVQRDKPSSKQASELVKDPDWDTFEEIEDYVYHSRSLLKRLLFPNLLWKQLFAPTQIDAERLRDQREQVLSTYNQITQFCTDSKNQLSSKSGLDKSAGWPELSQSHLTEVDQSCYPASVDPPEEYDSLGDYISAIETRIEMERDTLATIRHLLSDPEATFLYNQERTTLNSAREFLEYSVNMGKAQRRMLVRRRQGAIRFLEERLSSWEQEYEELRERSDPYLNLESYLYSDELLVEVNQLGERIESESQLGVDKWISHPVIKDCQNIQTKLSDLYDELRQTRKQYAHDCFEQVRMSVSQDISSLSQQLSPARNIGQKITNETRFIEQIENIRQEIDGFIRSPYDEHIPVKELDSLRNYHNRLDELERFIDQKTAFDNIIQDCTENLETLKTDLSPYLDYKKYLTRPAYEDVSKRIVEFRRSIRRLKAEIELSILAESDRKRVNELVKEVNEVDEQLSPDKYNSNFVRIEKKRCESLFSDIGDSNLDLTHEQQKAVIKNGIYNQVIAAAGTGKTLTLTTRVAYLVRRQDVDPSDILVVTYTNEATDEMRGRLRDNFGITDITVKTIQSFGYELIQEAAGQSLESIGSNEQKKLY